MFFCNEKRTRKFCFASNRTQSFKNWSTVLTAYSPIFISRLKIENKFQTVRLHLHKIYDQTRHWRTQPLWSNTRPIYLFNDWGKWLQLSVSVAQTRLLVRGVKWSAAWRYHFDYFSSSASTTFSRKWLLVTASSWWHFLAFSQGCILIWNVLVLPTIHSRLRQCGATTPILMLFQVGAIFLLGLVPLTTCTTRCGMQEWRLLKEWKMWLRRVS